MFIQVVAVRLLLLSLCNVAVIYTYTPNNFYPAFRGSAQFLQRGRSRFWDPKTFAVQPRTQAIEEDENETLEFPLLSPKDKRLMGIFRCYGWGPGCSDSSLFFAPRQTASSSSSSPSSQIARSRENEISNSPAYKSSSTPLQQRTSTGNAKFEPFFTLTSGGSWGPTGKKRSGGRRYSVAEKRLDFLKQILRDMLEEIDEDESDGTARSAGLRRTKRYAIYRRAHRFLADVERLQRAFGRRPQAIGFDNEVGFSRKL